MLVEVVAARWSNNCDNTHNRVVVRLWIIRRGSVKGERVELDYSNPKDINTIDSAERKKRKNR